MVLCCETTNTHAGGWSTSRPCKNEGRYKEDGEHYCGVHAPSKRRERQKKRDDNRKTCQAKHGWIEAKAAEYRLQSLRPLVRAAVACYEAYKRMELPGFDGLEETLKMVAAIDALPDDVVEWAGEGE